MQILSKHLVSSHHPWDKVQRPWYAMQGPPWPAPNGNTNAASCQFPKAIMNTLGSPVPSCTHLSLYLWCTCPLPVHKSQLNWYLFGEASPGPCCASTHPRLIRSHFLGVLNHLSLAPLSHCSCFFGRRVCLSYKTLSHLRARIGSPVHSESPCWTGCPAQGGAW